MPVYTTRTSCHINAPRSAVYAELFDPDSVGKWRVPTGMTSVVHEFDASEGGAFRVSLTYDGPAGIGKSHARTDTYHGRCLRLVPDELVVEVLEFETPDAGLGGEMTMTTTLSDEFGGTLVVVAHEGIPDSVPVQDNEAGTRMALVKLTELVEARTRP